MSKEIIPASRIAQSIYLLRGQKVMLSQDLASFYGVSVGALTQAMNETRIVSRGTSSFTLRLRSLQT